MRRRFASFNFSWLMSQHRRTEADSVSTQKSIRGSLSAARGNGEAGKRHRSNRHDSQNFRDADLKISRPGTGIETAVGNGSGDFEQRGIGMGFMPPPGHQTDPDRRVG